MYLLCENRLLIFCSFQFTIFGWVRGMDGGELVMEGYLENKKNDNSFFAFSDSVLSKENQTDLT